MCLCALSIGASAAAQEPYPAAPNQEPYSAALDQTPAHVSFVDGVAILERDGEIDDSPISMPLLSGDRLRTRMGRLEVLFADGATLHLDNHTVIDLQSDELIRLIEGRVRLSIPGPTAGIAYRIDGPQGWAAISEAGDYRIATLNGPRGQELEFVVLRGRAELVNEGGRTPLRAGERAFVRAGEAPSFPYVANSAAWDAFDRWSEARRDERLRANAEYLPDEVRPYAATLDQYGYWRHEPTYGAVWYPRVHPDWRPYYRGRWVSLRPYGWTWVAYDPWGWPTHHYGRWGFSGSAWFWIPGRRWGAAWVSWASAPGYISWCPLGWDNRPVFSINVNIGIGRHYDPWRAWTILPRHHFGVGFVHHKVVQVHRLDHRVRTAFVHRDRGPDFSGRVIPRSGVPIRVAGARPRAGGTVYTNLPPDRARVSSAGRRIEVPQGARAPRSDEDRGLRSDAARPASENAVRRAVPRDRTVPDRPAVRSRSMSSAGARPSPSSSPGVSNEPNRSSRAVAPRGNADAGGPSSARRAVTRPAPRSSAPVESPRSVTSPSPTRPDQGVNRSRPGLAAPAVRPESTQPRAVPRREYGSRPQPEYTRPPAAGARPPAAGARPSGASRSGPPVERGAPQIQRRGPEPRASGSYERRGPTRSAAPRAESPSRSGPPAASSPSGARPRPSGGEGAGRRAVRRPSGGGQ